MAFTSLLSFYPVLAYLPYNEEKERKNGGVVMSKVDYKKTQKEFYALKKGVFHFVDVPEMKILCIDGEGNPGTAKAFQMAVEALFAFSYTLKFQMKAEGFDYVVMPLEGQFYMDDMSQFSEMRKDEWKWTLMIRQPDQVTKAQIEKARKTVESKKNPEALDQVRFETFIEGKSAQILYLGPYSEETETIQALHGFIEENGCTKRGRHHEIYLNDMRRTAPEKLKTIIRQPVE
jgi:hypothetical protein